MILLKKILYDKTDLKKYEALVFSEYIIQISRKKKI